MRRRNFCDFVEKIIHRKVLSISLIATFVLLMMLGTVPASAAVRSTHHSISSNASPTIGSCYYSPGPTNCDGQDPKTNPNDPIKCSTISTIQGGDPWYLQVDYAVDNSNHCLSNWGTAYAPNNEYVQMVSIFTQDNRALYYCTSAAVSGPCHGLRIQAVIPNGYHSWYTDMLWAPNTKFQMCEIWSPNIGNLNGHDSQCSILH